MNKLSIISALGFFAFSEQALAGINSSTTNIVSLACETGFTTDPTGYEFGGVDRGYAYYHEYYDRFVTPPRYLILDSVSGVYSDAPGLMHEGETTKELTDFITRFGYEDPAAPLLACYPKVTAPVVPVDPVAPTFSFDNTILAACPLGMTVGGVAGASTYRTGTIPFYTTYDYKTGKGSYFLKSFNGVFSVIPETDNGDGTTSFPSFGANDVDLYGKWNEGSVEACATPPAPVDPTPPTEPVTPTNPTNPDKGYEAVSALEFREYCPIGYSVGGVAGASLLRLGTIPIFTNYVGETNTTYWSMRSNKSGAYNTFYSAQSAVGIIPYPEATQSLVNIYGSMNPGSEQPCLPVFEVPAVPTYSFDLPYNEYCSFGETVGGIAGGSTSRTGKVPVYYLFDSVTFTSKNYFFDGSDYVPLQMVEMNGFSTFPIITKEMVQKYGAMDTNSIEICKAVPAPPVEPIPPQAGWTDYGEETCAVGSTSGGIEGGATTRWGEVAVWVSTDQYSKTHYFFKAASSGALTEFRYEDFPNYYVNYSFGPSVIDLYGVWDSDSVQTCSPVRTSTDQIEVETVACEAPLTGSITHERTYKSWSDGVKDSYSEWKTTANHCVAPTQPPVVTPPVIVVPPVTQPVDPVEPPVTEPTEPPVVTPPVTEPTEPPVTEPVEPVDPPVTEPVPPVDDKFTPLSDFRSSSKACDEAQTGSIQYNEHRSYDFYPNPLPNGTIKNDTGWVMTVVNTCKDIEDDVIDVEEGEQNEECPAGAVGQIVVKGQWITKALSGKTWHETSRLDYCVFDIDNFITESISEDCPDGQTGTITKVRYLAIKTDGTTSYPYGDDYKRASDTCVMAGSSDDSATPVDPSKPVGLLRNQTIRAEDTAVITHLTEYVNGVNVDADGDYRLHIVVTKIGSKGIDSSRLGSLINAWYTKTKGTVDFSMMTPASDFIGFGDITAANSKSIILLNSSFNQKNGALVVSYKETQKNLKTQDVKSFEIPFIDLSKTGKSLKYIRLGDKQLD